MQSAFLAPVPDPAGISFTASPGQVLTNLPHLEARTGWRAQDPHKVTFSPDANSKFRTFPKLPSHSINQDWKDS